MPPKKNTTKKPPKASEMTPDVSVDLSGVIRAIHAAKKAVTDKLPALAPGQKMVHIAGKRYIRYSPTGTSKRNACLSALDRAAALLLEASKGAKVWEQG